MKHVHAELMALYAQDAMETDIPWDRWESKAPNSSFWIHMKQSPAWLMDHEYRRKPRTIKVNGFDVPEPILDPKNGCTYWLVDPTDTSFAAILAFQDSSTWRVACRDRGLIHATKEAAAKHAMAMCGIDPATYKEEE